jgi:CheY-like chemotaxis protein
VLFLFKPLKPSKIAVVFDPQKKSEVATDQNQNSAQAVAMTQKVIFQDLKNRLGDRQLRVLLIEDNKTSQMVISRFLGRVGVDVEVAVDGAEGTKKVFDMGERAQKVEGKLWDLVLVSSSQYWRMEMVN